MSLPKRVRSAWQYLFGDAASAFGTLSAVLLIVLAIVPAKDYFREWLGYQKQYLRLIRGRGDATSLNRRFQGGLQQIWMPELGVVDRCTTCHTALKEASLADVKTQPFRPHPVIPHKLTEFGCVICHRGQGGATTVEEAHSSTKSWEEPILPARFLEASCGQCHLDRLMGTPRLNQGRDALAQYGCVRCHTIKSPDGVVMTGADAPPPLQHIAEKTTREWIAAWLKNPQAYAGSATMPNFQLADDETRDISAFLIAQSTPYQTHKGTEPAPAASQDTAALQEGTSLYGESFCSSCHAMQNAAGMLVGGNLGPELTRAGSKVKTEWLADWLRDPKTYDPDTRMLTWSIAYSGLSSPATMAHFHGPAAAGANGPVTLWLSKQGMAPESPITGSATLSPEQAQQFMAGQWYINVHSKDHPPGEIRGQVTPPKG